MKKTPAKGSTAKHTGTSKHGRTAKHHPAAQKAGPTAAGGKQTTVAKHPTHAKARAWSPGVAVACCSAEAVAASLRLAGGSVSPWDVLALHRAAGGSDSAGASIWAVLEAALAAGLGGTRPLGFTPVREGAIPPGAVLGLELPGPHAVTVAPDGCWVSWGQHYDPAGWPDAVAEEAWAVTWP